LRIDYDNALAALEAEESPAPEIEGMKEANYFGGSLTHDGKATGTFAGTAPPTEGIARGGGKTKRIAPTPVDRLGQPLVGPFGTTLESAVTHARTLSPQERKAAIVKLQRELAALKIVEGEVEEVGSEDSQDDEDDEMGVRGLGFKSVPSSYTGGHRSICTYVSPASKSDDNEKKRKSRG
jgi:hypothetical protein